MSKGELLCHGYTEAAELRSDSVAAFLPSDLTARFSPYFVGFAFNGHYIIFID